MVQQRAEILAGPIGPLSDFLQHTREVSRVYCTQLGLGKSVSSIAPLVFANLLDAALSGSTLEAVSDHCVIALSIYIAADLAGRRQSFAQIARVISDVAEGEIGAAHQLVNLDVVTDNDIRNEVASLRRRR